MSKIWLIVFIVLNSVLCVFHVLTACNVIDCSAWSSLRMLVMVFKPMGSQLSLQWSRKIMFDFGDPHLGVDFSWIKMKWHV